MQAQQIGFDFDSPKIETNIDAEEKSAHDCFWTIHQYMEKCDCLISWTDWEEKTGRKIWDIA